MTDSGSSTNPFERPGVESTADARRLQRAAEYGLAALCVTAVGVCCFPTVFLGPLFGILAWLELRKVEGPPPVAGTPTHLARRVASLGAGISIGVGGVFALFTGAYAVLLAIGLLVEPAWLERLGE